MMRITRQRAFTLLEVLVALSILAVGLTAAIISSIEITRNSTYLQDKTFAHWLAENILAERQLARNRGTTTPTTSTGTSLFARQSWDWAVTTQASANPALRQITVQVTRGKQRYANLQSYEYVNTTRAS